MARYVHADANLYGHIRTLRVVSITLSLGLMITMYGWHQASRNQRISIPPDIRYGSEVTLNTIHPWEVYNFAGYIWQQLNRCPTDCLKDYSSNLGRLTAFLTPEFKVWLANESNNRTSELRGRTRYILPSVGASYINSVYGETGNSWTVSLDVDLHEHIGGVEVKTVQIKYYIRVVRRRIDPEFNPWGLLLDTMPYPPERILKSASNDQMS